MTVLDAKSSMRLSPNSADISLWRQAPTTTNVPWLHQAFSAHQSEYDDDFASNASFKSIPKNLQVVLTTPDRITKGYRLAEYKLVFGATQERKAGKVMAMAKNGGSSGAIRKSAQRVFHPDQLYPHLSVRAASASSSSSLSPRETLFELPQPSSLARRRVKFRQQSRLGSVLAKAQSCSRYLLAHPTTYLALYFVFNLGLTLYNKSVLIKFPFPYTLSALHALCGTIGSFILIRTDSTSTPVPSLNGQEKLVLLAFSGLYTLNIAVSNVSLGLVTVPFHQVVRAATPLFTILLSALILGTKSSRTKMIALLPVVAGVGFATYGDYYCTSWGFILSLLGTLLASLKTIYTNILQTPNSPKQNASFDAGKHPSAPVSSLARSKLPPLLPLHLLYLLSPLAFLESTLLAQFTGELGRVREFMFPQSRLLTSVFARSMPVSPGISSTQLFFFLINGVMAFGLNVVSFSANRKVGALSMTVAANVKQVLTILCAVAMFDLPITPMNGIGIILTLIGGVLYTSIELKEKREQAS
ncbi:hypothetical protein H0H92_000704 [Tricholoma furcatifolium]|nr:hypothetical protein H0H92_000704 [Tricholoma furcatifolium]